MTGANRRHGWAALVLLVVFAVAGGGWSLRLGQDVNWDQRNYHLYNAYAWSTGRLAFDVGPAQIQTFLPQLYNLPFYALVMRWPPALVGFVLGAFHGVVLFMVLAIAWATLRGRGKGVLVATAVVVGASGAAIHGELGTTMGDDTTAAFVLAGVLAVLWPPAGPASAKGAAIAGLAVGVAAGLKYTNAIYGVALVGALAVVALRGRAPWRSIPTAALAFVAGALLVAGPWMWRLERLYASPLFPFWNQLFRSPYYAPTAFHDPRWLPTGVADALALPFTVATVQQRTMEFPFRDPRWAILAVLGLVATSRVLVPRTRDTADAAWMARGVRAFLLAFGVIGFLVWDVAFGHHRYLAALEALSGVVLIAVLDVLCDRRAATAGAALVLGGAVVLLVQVPSWGRLPWAGTWYGIDRVPVAADTLVVMLGDEPFSYVIPFFPPSVRFVRPQGNLFPAAQDTRFTRRIAEVVAAHRGPVEAMWVEAMPAGASALLARHGLAVDPSRCRPLATRIGDHVVRCGLERIGSPAPAAEPDGHAGVLGMAQADTPPSPAGPASAIDVGDPAAAGQLDKGFYAIESGWRWTAPTFSLTLGVPSGAAAKGGILRFRFYLPAPLMSARKQVRLEGRVGSLVTSEVYTAADAQTLELPLPASALAGRSVTVEFAVDQPFTPGNGDLRQLGVVARSAELVVR